MTNTYVCDILAKNEEAKNLIEASQKYFASIGGQWKRITVHQKGKGWDSPEFGNKRKYLNSEVPDSLKNTLGYFKIVRRDTSWVFIRIKTRQFDHLSLAKMREICNHYKIDISFVTPCKEMILDVLDDHIKEIKNFLRGESLSQYLGSFEHQWFYSEGEKKDITLNLKPDSPKRTIDVTKKGIIETLLERLDQSQNKAGVLSREFVSLKKEHSILEKTHEDTKKELESSQTSLEPFAKAGFFYYQEVTSESGEDVIKLSVDELGTFSHQINVTEEGFIGYFLRTTHDLSRQIKEEKSFSDSLKEKERKAQQTIIQLTTTLDKVSSSFVDSESENDRLRKENDELKQSLIMTKAENSVLRTEFAISKIVPDNTPKSESTVDSFFLPITDPNFECY